MKATPLTLLRSHHRQALWMPAVWTAVAGLALLFIVGHWWHPNDIKQYLTIWSEGLVLIALCALLARLRSRHSKQAVACALDTRLMAHNRVEAAAELAHRTDALAEAQRRDTAAFLSSHQPPPAWHWPAGLAMLVILVAAQLLMFGWQGFKLFAADRSAQMAATVAAADKAKLAAKDPAASDKPAPKSNLPVATLNWVSPSPESSAAPIEEVPLTAEADSTTGLKTVSLIVTVNGEARPEIKLPNAVASGHQSLELSLYLDELNVQPFDMLSYYLKAQPEAPAGGAADAPMDPVTSPLQFLQVRPLWDDTKLAKNQPSAPPPPNNNPANPMTTLKLAQVKLMRDTFGLASDTAARSNPDWPNLNKVAGSAQAALADRTHEAIATVQADGAPPEVVDLLTKAEGQMKAAVVSLDKPDPDAAGGDQGQALASLTAVEKYYTKVLSMQDCNKPPIPDPFKVNQPYKLPPREKTAAGQLEQLARDQATLADQLASTAASSPSSSPSGSSPNPSSNPGAAAGSKPGSSSGSSPGSSPGAGSGSGSGSDPSSGTPTVAAMNTQQQKLANDIGMLALAGSLPKETWAAINSAAAASLEAANKLSADDPSAASEPAARAAADLRDAIAKMDAGGRANTAALLSTAQRTLNQSAGDIAGAKPDTSKTTAANAADSTAQLEKTLRDAATKQQEQGSLPAAQQLADLANAIDASKVQNDLKNLVDTGPAATDKARQGVAGKLTALAQSAANGQGAIGDQDALAAQALEALRRDRVNLDRADKAGASSLRGLHEDVLAQAQIALSSAMGRKLVASAESQGDGKRVNDPVLGPITMLTPPPPPLDDPQHKPFMQMMGSQIDALISVIGKMDDISRPQVLTTGQASDAPPAYRPAVASYFESLAHEPAPTPAQP